MELNTKQIRKANATFALLMGILVLALKLNWVYYIFTILLLIVFIPSVIYTLLNIKEVSKYVIVYLFKSILCVITGICLFLIADCRGLFAIFTGAFVIIGVLLEQRVLSNDSNHLGNSFWQITIGLVLLIMGLGSLLPIKQLVIKYVLGGLMIILSILIIILSKEPKENIDEILADYERRYQETHKDDEENIIDVDDTEDKDEI